MAWNKNAEVILATLFTLLLVACGGDSGNSTEVADGDGREVATLLDMGRCTSEREGDTVYVAEKLTDYLCHNRTWVDLSQSPDVPISSSAENQEYSSAEDIQGSSSSDVLNDGEESSSSFNKEAYTDENLVVKNRSILGVAQKGPFKFGSPVYLRELSEDSLFLTGMVYEDEISSNKGDFVIPNVNLIYPYASVEVRGLYRNEMTGEYSENPISLYALTDLKTAVTDSKDDARNKVNVNLLTHLEYNRAIYLVRKGYSVYAAKKQADQEIMTAFELPTTIKYSEDLSVFEDSEDDNVDYANASLMMLNLLFLGEGDDAEIKASIDKFIADIEKDGEWNDDSTKARMADFATTVNGDEIRANVKAWNILNIPMFETQMEMFWNNVYGLGGCAPNRKGLVTPNSNKLSKNYNKYFICNSAKWVEATTFEKDTYEWVGGENGEFKKGNVTDTLYVYDGSKWVAAERETTIGLCVKSNAGVVSEFEGTYYICRDSAWVEATELEYDTYGLLCSHEGTIVSGKVVSSNKYVCDADTFRAAANEEITWNLGCTSYTQNQTEIQETEFRKYTWLCSSKWTIKDSTFIYGMLTDARGGTTKTYKTVKIGDQIWMAENLNYAPNKNHVDSLGESAWSGCYGDAASNCVKYGRLYTWQVAMDKAGCDHGKTCSPNGTIRGVCPEGWHLPSNGEFETLINYIDPSFGYGHTGDAISSTAGYYLKATSGWNDSGNGGDTYGFSALPGGDYAAFNWNFSGVGHYASFWSSTEYNSNNAYYLDLYYYDDRANLLWHYKHFARSVRCLKDSL